MRPAIDIDGLCIRYRGVTAVDGLSLTVEPGEVFGFVGPNGAGKTSTIRTLLDLRRPDGGTVRVLGTDVRAGGPALRARCGFLPGDLALFPWLTGTETLAFFAQLYGRPPIRRDEVLDRLGFRRDALDRRLRTYSTGMRQQIGIACAFQHEPELLVLDEPTTGLDPMVREAFLSLVRDTGARGGTVFLSSHVLDEIEDCCARVALIHRGVLRHVDRVDALRARLPRVVVLRWRDGTTERREFTGEPAALLREIDLDALADIEIRPAELRDVFRDAVREDRP